MMLSIGGLAAHIRHKGRSTPIVWPRLDTDTNVWAIEPVESPLPDVLAVPRPEGLTWADTVRLTGIDT